MTDAVVHTRIKKVQHAAITDVEDVVATEEPLEIRLVCGPSHNRRQQSVSITMRTPGNDQELAAGFLFTEGIISAYSAIAGIHLQHDEDQSIATVQLQENVIPVLGAARRSFAATAACGVCGKTDLAAIHTGVTVSNDAPLVHTTADIIYQLPAALQQEQAAFNTTGGLHAAALFDTAGHLQLLREDIGRHNAVDKIIGAALQAPQLHLSNCLLLLSGRAGFELIQKAAMANIPLIAAVGAPSSLAIKMAASWNITLIGFLRGEKFNIYTGAERITCK